MINIEISSDLESAAADYQDHLHQACQHTLQQAGKVLDDVEMTIVLTDDEQLRQLNHHYLQIDAPTDVLAFPVGDRDPHSGTIYLGDVIISYHQAVRQAAEGGHPLLDELRLLSVHGTLHLCGYKHSDEITQASMWQVQQQVLESLGSTLKGPAAPHIQ